MVYSNFLLRLLLSMFFISLYLFLSYINFNYVFYLIILIYFLVFIEIYFNFKSYKVIPTIYILISFIFFITINFNNEIFLKFNLFILTVVTFDIFSYLFGKFFGQHKLTKISPKKTYEGLLGGIVSSFLFSLLFSYIFKIKINFSLIVFILLIILSAFIGDILESYYKRKNNIKNSSKLIPGHGGVFDRFDSFLFSIIFFSISNNIAL